MSGRMEDFPKRTSGAVADAMERDGSVQKLATAGVAKAADDAADSKGPAGIGKFGDFAPQDFLSWKNATNPYGAAVEMDNSARGQIGQPARGTGSLGNALRQASGVVPTDRSLGEMEGRLFKAFTDAEEREPNAEDAEFWKAMVVVQEAHGVEVGEAIRKAANGELHEQPATDPDEFTERFSKALADDSPAWVKEMVKRHADD